MSDKIEEKATAPAAAPSALEVEITKLLEKSVKGSDGKLNVLAAKEAIMALKAVSARLSGAVLKTLEAHKADLDSQIAAIKKM